MRPKVGSTTGILSAFARDLTIRSPVINVRRRRDRGVTARGKRELGRNLSVGVNYNGRSGSLRRDFPAFTAAIRSDAARRRVQNTKTVVDKPARDGISSNARGLAKNQVCTFTFWLDVLDYLDF